MPSSDDMKLLSLAVQTFREKINPEVDINFHSLEELEDFLKGLVLCPSCVDVYFACNRKGGVCWSCNAVIEIVDSLEARDMGGVAATIVGSDDQEPLYLVGSEGDGWAFSDWCQLIDQDADHYDFWFC